MKTKKMGITLGPQHVKDLRRGQAYIWTKRLSKGQRTVEIELRFDRKEK